MSRAGHNSKVKAGPVNADRLKSFADRIVRDHNRAPEVIPPPPPQDNAHVAPGCELFPEAK